MQALVRDHANLVRYRAMESLCRQRAVFHPLESWQLLAEAEMWHHKAMAEIVSNALPGNGDLSAAAASQAVSLPRDGDPGRRSAD